MTGGHEVAGSSPVAPISQPSENKPLRKSKADNKKPQSENLAEILFSESELDEDLKLLVQRWPKLSVETKRIIIKIIETS